MTPRATYAVVRGPRLDAVELRDLRHRLDADDALDRKVRLVRETTCEVVGAELIRGYQRVCNQELRPLIEEAELGNEVRWLLGCFVAEHH